MQQTRNPLIRNLIHLGLIVWVLYSVFPFVMAVITSLQVTRDATARQPRFMPQALVENNIAIVLLLGVFIIGAFLYMRRNSDAEPVRGVHYLSLLMVMAVVMGGFYLITTSVEDNQTFQSTWASYETLWLNVDSEEFAPVGISLVILISALVIIGIGASRFVRAKVYVYLGIVGVVVLTIILLPTFTRFAEFYSFFLNSVIVTVGTVAISISIGCLAGYGLARYSGYVSIVLLFAALAFRALPRLAFILPYYYFAQLSGLYDTYVLLIITFVAINQPFTIWMLRSFFLDIPRELEEAAMIDGCNRITAFFRIIVPITWPGIITTSLFTLLLAYNEFLLARLLTSTLWTLPVGISRFTSGEDVRLLPL